MKASVKQYARSLFELVAGKSESETKAVIAKFLDFLRRRQELNKAEAIISELTALFDENAGEIAVELASARPLSAESKQIIISYLEKRTNGSKIKFLEKIEPELLGGFVLRYNGLVIDGSLKNNLLKFKKQLSN